MKTHTPKKEMTFVVPSENGEVVELKIDIAETKKIAATTPMLKELERRCTAVATSNDYNLLFFNV